jgi:hypothetical protein
MYDLGCSCNPSVAAILSSGYEAAPLKTRQRGGSHGHQTQTKPPDGVDHRLDSPPGFRMLSMMLPSTSQPGASTADFRHTASSHKASR